MRFLVQFRVETLVDKLVENPKYLWPDFIGDLNQFKFGFDSENVGKFLGSNAQSDRLPFIFFSGNKLVKIRAGYWVLYGLVFDDNWHQLQKDPPNKIEADSLKSTLCEIVRDHFVKQNKFKAFNLRVYRQSMEKSLSNPIDVVDDFQIDSRYVDSNENDIQDINDRIDQKKILCLIIFVFRIDTDKIINSIINSVF